MMKPAIFSQIIEKPYFQHFTGEVYFQHEFSIGCSDMTHWRYRVREDFCVKLLQESLRIACETGALRTKNLKRAVVDTTVQEKALTHPTELTYKALTKLDDSAKDSGIPLRLYLYSSHCPEVECIGKGKTHKPYEFRVKVTFGTNVNRAPGGHFILHAKALPGRLYDGHTFRTVLDEMGDQVGIRPKRIYVDKGYSGHGIKAK